MRLIDKSTGKEIQTGDEVDYGNRGSYYLSGLDPKGLKIFLFKEPGDGGPIVLSPSAIGAEIQP